MRGAGLTEASKLVHLDVLGQPISLRISGSRTEDVAARIAHAWGWCLTERPAARDRSSVVSVDADPGRDPAELLHDLTPMLTTRGIEDQAGKLLMLHAAALANPVTGASVVLVGPSGMGKTTVARTLGTSMSYLTDETAAITRDGRVLPFPKPLSVLPETGGPVKTQVAPGDVGLLPPPTETRVAAVVLLDRRQDAGARVSVEHVPTVQAIAALAAHTSYLSRLDRPLARIAALLSDTGGLRRVSYRDADSLRPVVSNLAGMQP